MGVADLCNVSATDPPFTTSAVRYCILLLALLALPLVAMADPPDRSAITLGVGVKGMANDATQAVFWARLRALKHVSIRGEAYGSLRYVQPTLAATYDLPLFSEHVTLFVGPGYTYNNDGHRLYNPHLMAGGTLRFGRIHLQATVMDVLRKGDPDYGGWVGFGIGF